MQRHDFPIFCLFLYSFIFISSTHRTRFSPFSPYNLWHRTSFITHTVITSRRKTRRKKSHEPTRCVEKTNRSVSKPRPRHYNFSHGERREILMEKGRCSSLRLRTLIAKSFDCSRWIHKVERKKNWIEEIGVLVSLTLSDGFLRFTSFSADDQHKETRTKNMDKRREKRKEKKSEVFVGSLCLVFSLTFTNFFG